MAAGPPTLAMGRAWPPDLPALILLLRAVRLGFGSMGWFCRCCVGAGGPLCPFVLDMLVCCSRTIVPWASRHRRFGCPLVSGVGAVVGSFLGWWDHALVGPFGSLGPIPLNFPPKSMAYFRQSKILLVFAAVPGVLAAGFEVGWVCSAQVPLTTFTVLPVVPVALAVASSVAWAPGVGAGLCAAAP